MESKMELPDDVLAIIRAYAKPRFKYFREYNKAVQALGPIWYIEKYKLQQNEDKIITILLPYVDAYVESKLLRKQLFDFVTPMKYTHPHLVHTDDYYRERERQVDQFWLVQKRADELFAKLVR